MQHAHPAGVIAMVVGNQDGIDACRFSVMESKPFFDLFAADSGIEQQIEAASLDVDAIAVAAGLEGNDAHGNFPFQLSHFFSTKLYTRT
jgi:hypothetical protein